MSRVNRAVGDCRVGAHRWGVLRPGPLEWSVLAVMLLAGPWLAWGQSNALNQAVQSIGAPIRMGPLHPEQLQELRGQPLCVYNFTSW